MLRWIIAVLTLFVAFPSLANAQAKKKPPNIIYIMSDDHANAAIGAYGSWLKPVVKTPNLDKLAKRRACGSRNSMVTNSICTPSRAAMLTGQYSHKNGVYTLDDPLSEDTMHIGHLLQRSAIKPASSANGTSQIDPTGLRLLEHPARPGRIHQSEAAPHGHEAKELKEYTGGYSEDVITDLSLDWLKKRDKTSRSFYVPFQGAASAVGPGAALQGPLQGREDSGAGDAAR